MQFSEQLQFQPGAQVRFQRDALEAAPHNGLVATLTLAIGVRRAASKSSTIMGLMGLGEGDEGFHMLNETLREMDTSLFFRQFHSDPRWKGID